MAQAGEQMPIEPRLEHKTVKVKQLVESYRGGRIVIPEFQREYVWRRSKAPRLIDFNDAVRAFIRIESA